MENPAEEELLNHLPVTTASSNAAREAGMKLVRRVSSISAGAQLSRRPTSLTEDAVTGMLPDEVLLLIFSGMSQVDELPRLACVCKRWRLLAQDELLWEDVDIAGRTMTLGKLV